MRKYLTFFTTALVIASFAVQVMPQKGRSLGPAKQKLSTPVESTRFANFTAYTDGQVSWLTWQMDVEVGNIGFNVYRVGKGGPELLTGEKFVKGAATRIRLLPTYGERYDFFDRNGDGNSAYYIETISLQGTKTATHQLYPQYTSDLRAVTGMSSDDIAMRISAEPANLESSILTYTKEIAQEIEENQQLADPVTHRMVISQPGVVRIGVKREGIYRVPRAQLEGAGFDAASDSMKWQLYVEGVEQPMLIGPGASYIEFYGKGTDTVEADIRQYYLLNGSTAGKRIESRVAVRNTSTVVTPNYFQTFVKKERTIFVENVFNGDAENYWGRGINGSGLVPAFPFTLSGVDFTVPNARLRVRFQGFSDGPHAVEVTLNGEVLPTMATGTSAENFVASYDIPTSFLREGANTVKFRALGTPTDFVYFDSVSVDFSRKYLADQNKLAFYTQNYRIARLEGFTSANVRVFDMTREGAPVLMTNLVFQQNGPTFGVDMPAARGRSFYAVEDSALVAPESVTPNNPELIRLPTHAANLVIISYKDFMTQAEAWAQYRRNQGFTVKVIEVSEIFDEFNLGTLSSLSIKDFLQYAYQNWATPPQYVLLLGDASWDSRNYENFGFWNFVPARMVTTRHLETASDEALADFDNDGLAELAVGRVSARTVANVETVFSKTTNWESALTPTSMDTRGSLFAYDHDGDFSFELMSNLVRNQLPQSVPATFVYRGEVNANTNLINAMNTGKFIVNYAGHGTAGSWGGNPLFFNVFSVPTTSDHSPAIYTMLTCLNGYFHWLYNPSIAEVLIQAPNKGAVVAWGSSALTTPDIQQDMALRFYQKLGEGTIPRMGDLVKDAKTVVTGSTDVRYSWVLIGDPMLKVR